MLPRPSSDGEPTPPRRHFRPPPRVDSSVVSLKPRRPLRYAGEQQQRFFTLINAAFAQRRKTVVNSIVNSRHFHVEKPDLTAALERCDIDPGWRAERLSLAQYYSLFDTLEQSPA